MEGVSSATLTNSQKFLMAKEIMLYIFSATYCIFFCLSSVDIEFELILDLS